MAERRRRRKWWITGAVLAAFAVVGAGVYLQARSSDPLTSDEALGAFRRAGSGAGESGSGPRPGVYTYRATGNERGGAGPISIGREVPAEARLVVTGDGAGWYAELSYSKQHVEGARYEVREGEIVITRRRTKVTFAGFGRDDLRALDPPSRFLPADPAVGTSWDESYRAGDLSVAVRTRVARAEVLEVSGVSVPTLVIVSDATTAGAHPGTRSETVWWSEDLVLPVRWEVDMTIGGAFGFDADTSLTLTSIEPEV